MRAARLAIRSRTLITAIATLAVLYGLVAVNATGAQVAHPSNLATAERVRADSASFNERCVSDLRHIRSPLVSYDPLEERAMRASSIVGGRYEVEDDRHYRLVRRGPSSRYARGVIVVGLPWWHSQPATAQALARSVNGTIGMIREGEHPIGSWYNIRVKEGTEVASVLTLIYDCRTAYVYMPTTISAPDSSVTVLLQPDEYADMQPARSQVADSTPDWNKRLVPWESHVDEERPWRADARVYRYLHKQFRDDAQVVFPIDGRAAVPFEAMWVRTIAYDSLSDQYLGILLNRPAFIRSVAQFDNVVFRADSGRPPKAVGSSDDYDKPGWPQSLVPEFVATLRDGIRAYRSGRNGHNMPGIERCVEILTPAVRNIPLRARPDERFVAHFLLGRCLAEQYDTDRAIVQFRAAIAVDPTDVDGQMALLAELTVKAHAPVASRSATDIEHWDRALSEQLAVIRGGFLDSPGIRRTLEVVFDPRHDPAGSSPTAAEAERRKRIGSGTLRWKRR